MQYKKAFWVFVGACVVSMLIAEAAMPVSAWAAQPVRLKFANYFPPAAGPSKICQEFIADIEKRTGGRVKITYYPGGSLLKAPAIFGGVAEGVSDMGLSSVAYATGRMPVTETLGLPLGYPNPWVSVHVANDFYKKFKPKEWDQVHVLWMHTSGITVMMTKKPIRTMDDLKGVIVRAPGRVGETVKALGGTPAPTEMGEVYDAISKGVIHGVYTGIMGLKDWRFSEVVGYTTLAWQVSSVYPFYVIMNKNSYAKLPQDIREIFDKTAGEYEEKFALMWNNAEVQGKEFGAKSVQYIQLSNEEAARWRQAVKPVVDAYKNEMVAKGFAKKDVETWVSYAQERIDYWSKRQVKSGVRSATGPAEVLK